eukprot:scaffold14451_cov64-Phaeocystis_antarctica.AAC.2
MLSPYYGLPLQADSSFIPVGAGTWMKAECSCKSAPARCEGKLKVHAPKANSSCSPHVDPQQAPHTHHRQPPAACLPPPIPCHLPASCLPSAFCLPAATCCRLPHFYTLPACTDMAFYSLIKLAVLCALFQATAAAGLPMRFARLLELSTTNIKRSQMPNSLQPTRRATAWPPR